MQNQDSCSQFLYFQNSRTLFDRLWSPSRLFSHVLPDAIELCLIISPLEIVNSTTKNRSLQIIELNRHQRGSHSATRVTVNPHSFGIDKRLALKFSIASDEGFNRFRANKITFAV